MYRGRETRNVLGECFLMPRGFPRENGKKLVFLVARLAEIFPPFTPRYRRIMKKQSAAQKKNDFRVNLINKAKEEVTLFSM
jgi:hypothetical protein